MMDAMKKALQKRRSEKGAEIKIMIGIEDESQKKNDEDSELAPEVSENGDSKSIVEELMGSTSKPVGRHSMSLDEHARDMMEKKMEMLKKDKQDKKEKKEEV